MTLRIVPEGLAAASAGLEALSARLSVAHVGAAPLITAVAPLAVDHAAVAAQGVEVFGHLALGVGEAGTSYATGDAAATTPCMGGGG